jgi:hypothetical protein
MRRYPWLDNAVLSLGASLRIEERIPGLFSKLRI